MRRLFFILLILGFLQIYPAEAQDYFRMYEKQVRKELAAWSDLEHTIRIDSASAGRQFCTLLLPEGQRLGSLILTSAPGRFDRFDFMMVVDSLSTIRLIRILKYRSDYGSEITNRKWLAQFYRNPDSIFVYRKDIDAVSGATFSGRGLTEEVNAVLRLVGR